MRSLIKELRKTPTAKNLPALFSILDRAAKKQVIHKKRADRLKSRLTLLVNKEKPKTKRRPKNS
jgi:small subunit ribosomal protein S20